MRVIIYSLLFSPILSAILSCSLLFSPVRVIIYSLLCVLVFGPPDQPQVMRTRRRPGAIYRLDSRHCIITITTTTTIKICIIPPSPWAHYVRSHAVTSSLCLDDLDAHPPVRQCANQKRRTAAQPCDSHAILSCNTLVRYSHILMRYAHALSLPLHRCQGFSGPSPSALTTLPNATDFPSSHGSALWVI